MADRGRRHYAAKFRSCEFKRRMMTEEPVPPDVRDFILRHIDSIAQLEALLLLRVNPREAWDAERLSRRIYVSEQETTELLATLAGDGLLGNNEGVFHYECNDEAKRSLIERLADIYSRQLIPVTNLIHAKPRRIRQFADAFRFRKDR
jgi:hypothetical protein